jgi:hypothetical protein
MQSRKLTHDDEANGPFELPDSASEQTRPGLHYGDEKDSRGRAPGPAAEGHNRLTPRQKKEIPQKPLAQRLRDAGKGG